MKKFLLISLTAIALIFSGCSPDDSPNYGIGNIAGGWQMTDLEIEGEYVSVTSAPYSSLVEPTYVLFRADATYRSQGYFGTFGGPYRTSGDMVICSSDGQVVVTYEILFMYVSSCTMRMTIGDLTVNAKYTRVNLVEEEQSAE